MLKDLLALVPSRRYGVGDAWVLGRLGRAASDSLQTRFLAAEDPELKVRYLTLLSFSADTSAVPLLSRVYAAPDSFGVPVRYGSRASDALLWIGTRAAARGRGVADAITRALARIGFERGAARVILQASEMGLPVYQRIGFRTISSCARFLAPRPERS